jgi:hypothetical protein
VRQRQPDASEEQPGEGFELAAALSRADERTREPEFITAEEIGPEPARLGILEKRLDEEVRARMQLEERLIHVTEELKVMRDRMRRSELRDRPPT